MSQRVKPAEQGIVLDALSAGYGQTLIVDDINQMCIRDRTMAGRCCRSPGKKPPGVQWRSAHRDPS